MFLSSEISLKSIHSEVLITVPATMSSSRVKSTSIFQGKIHLFDANCKDLAARNMFIDVSETGGPLFTDKTHGPIGDGLKPIGSSTAEKIFIGETRFICLMITMETHENP